MARQIIVGVPGPWADRPELVEAVARRSGGFLYAGVVMVEIGTEAGFEVQFEPPDGRVENSFRIAGQGRFTADQLAEIGGHRSVVYLLADGHGDAAARAIQRAAAGLVRAGGFAVKVESAGNAHPGPAWLALTASDRPFDLYRSFVTLVGGPDLYYSCGMHVFGLPDANMPTTVDPEEAARVMNRFHLYQMTEKPKLADGHTFSMAADAPVYRMRSRRCTQFAPDDPFHNPYGMWHLEPADRPAAG